MLIEHRRDPRGTRAPFDPGKQALVANEHEGWSDLNAESPGEVAALVDVDLNDAKPVAFLARDMGDETFHAA